MFDDSDMKIVGAPGRRADETDTAAFLAESGRQHFNGNFAKAKELGANIVSAFSYKAAPDELRDGIRACGVEPDETALTQAKYLSVFSAEYCLNHDLPSPLLTSVAVGEMYEVLARVSPELYEALSHSAAFSFYYMSLNSGAPDGIGAQFAELCGRPRDPRYVALGERLHRANCAAYKKAIRSYVFV